MKKLNFLLLYIFIVFSLSITLWGLDLWKAENILYGICLILLQIILINLILKHRESETSIANYLLVIPSAFIMILIIKNLMTPLTISILISLVVLIPIHFLQKYIKYSVVES